MPQLERSAVPQHVEDPLPQQVVDRLKASQAEAGRREYRRGLLLGQNWACQTAEAPELERLADLVQDVRSGRWQIMEMKTSEEIADIATGEGMTFDEFWEPAAGEREPVESAEFLRGFVEGAVQVWEEAKARF